MKQTLPSKGASLFSVGDILQLTRKAPCRQAVGRTKCTLLKASGPDGLNARVLKECSNEISPILGLIFNEPLAWGDVPDDWQQADVSQ